MVGIDGLSQQVDAVKKLSDHHQVPICAVHAPCLLFTQRVWGTDPWGKLERSAEMAEAVGADVVVVHPPFRWQKDYAAGFVEGIASLEAHGMYLAGIEGHPPPRALVPAITAMQGSAMGVSHAVLFKAWDLQARPRLPGLDEPDS